MRLLGYIRAVLEWATAEDVRRERDEWAKATSEYMQWIEAFRADCERQLRAGQSGTSESREEGEEPP